MIFVWGDRQLFLGGEFGYHLSFVCPLLYSCPTLCNERVSFKLNTKIMTPSLAASTECTVYPGVRATGCVSIGSRSTTPSGSENSPGPRTRWHRNKRWATSETPLHPCASEGTVPTGCRPVGREWGREKDGKGYNKPALLQHQDSRENRRKRHRSGLRDSDGRPWTPDQGDGDSGTGPWWDVRPS